MSGPEPPHPRCWGQFALSEFVLLFTKSQCNFLHRFPGLTTPGQVGHNFSDRRSGGGRPPLQGFGFLCLFSSLQPGDPLELASFKLRRSPEKGPVPGRVQGAEDPPGPSKPLAPKWLVMTGSHVLAEGGVRAGRVETDRGDVLRAEGGAELVLVDGAGWG